MSKDVKREEKYFRRQQESRNRKFPAAYQRGTIKKSYYFARFLKTLLQHQKPPGGNLRRSDP